MEVDIKHVISAWIFIGLIWFVNCDRSPEEKIVGEWMTVDEDLEWGFAINADSTIFEIHEESRFKLGVWRLNKTKPLVLSIYENGELQYDLNIRFINDNEIGFESRGKPIRMKRK